jgi:hypothetical protein
MISIITTFKPFNELARIHQINALQSWTKFIENPEIIVVGQSDGFESIVSEYKFKVKWIRDVKTSYTGAPYLDDMIKKSLKVAENQFMCIINDDIILLPDFMPAFLAVTNKYKDFLMTSRRLDLFIDRILNFDVPETVSNIKENARKNYCYHDDKRLLPIDLFVFNRDFLLGVNIPPLVYGRGVFVRWFIYNAYCKRVPVIDATPILTAIHQIHSHDHIKDTVVRETIKATSDDWKGIMAGSEFKWNINVAGPALYYSDGDFTHILTKDGLVKLNSVHHIIRRAIKTPLLPPYSRISLKLLKILLPYRKSRSIIKRTLKRYNLIY